MLSPSSLDALAFALDASSDAAALRRFPATLPGADETKNVLETKNAIEKKCVAWALALFERLFAEAPRDAVRANPPDSRTATGALFWSGTKRVPYALAFDVTDPHHATFVVAAATLRASALFDERKTSTRDTYSRDSLENFAAARARMLETLLETTRVTRNVTVRDETRVLKTHKKKTNDGAEVSVVKYEREEGDEKKKTGEDDAFSDDASRARRLDGDRGGDDDDDGGVHHRGFHVRVLAASREEAVRRGVGEDERTERRSLGATDKALVVGEQKAEDGEGSRAARRLTAR